MKKTTERHKKGTRRFFVGNFEIAKPRNHGYTPVIFETLIEQAAFTVKEWNGKIWEDLHTKHINTKRSIQR